MEWNGQDRHLTEKECYAEWREGKGWDGLMMTCKISKINSWLFQKFKIPRQTQAHKLNKRIQN